MRKLRALILGLRANNAEMFIAVIAYVGLELKNDSINIRKIEAVQRRFTKRLKCCSHFELR